jgi:hypothetical protein
MSGMQLIRSSPRKRGLRSKNSELVAVTLDSCLRGNERGRDAP